MGRTQTLVQLSERLLVLLDQRAVARGVSRSRLIREAVEAYLADDVDAAVSRQIIEGYERIPQATPDEWGVPSADGSAMARATMARVAEEERRAGADPW